MAEMWPNICFIFKVKPVIKISGLLNKKSTGKSDSLILLHYLFFSMSFMEEKLTGVTAVEKLFRASQSLNH